MPPAGLVGPVINFKAIKADYLTANARQLQAVYNYQRVIINAFTEVINRVAKVENYGKSIEIKKQQVQSLEAAVEAATSLYQLPRAELPIDYLDVLTAQNELFVAIRDLIETKGEQLSAIVNAYQALGGGSYLLPNPIPQSMQSHHWKILETLRSDRRGRPGSETASCTGGGGKWSGTASATGAARVVRDRFLHRRRKGARNRFQHRRRQVLRYRFQSTGAG